MHVSGHRHDAAQRIASKHVQAHPREKNVRPQHPSSLQVIALQPMHQADNIIRARNMRRVNKAAQRCPVPWVRNSQSPAEGGSTSDVHKEAVLRCLVLLIVPHRSHCNAESPGRLLGALVFCHDLSSRLPDNLDAPGQPQCLPLNTRIHVEALPL